MVLPSLASRGLYNRLTTLTPRIALSSALFTAEDIASLHCFRQWRP